MIAPWGADPTKSAPLNPQNFMKLEPRDERSFEQLVAAADTI
jgi:hypothetical protein